MHDFLIESEGQDEAFQPGFQQGLQLGQRLGQRRALEDAIIAITMRRFPQLINQSVHITEHIKHPAALQQVLLKISLAPTIEEAREYLLQIDDE